MKTIKVPPPIKQSNGADFTFDMYLRVSVLEFPLFGKGFPNIRKGAKILDAIELMKAEKLSELKLEDEHFNALYDALNAKDWGASSRHLIPFIQAIEDAKEE